MRIFDQFFLLRRETDPFWPKWERGIYYIWRFLLLAGAGLYTGWALLKLATGPYPAEVYEGYLSDPNLLWLNILPVAVLAVFFYGVFGRVWAAFLAGGGIFLACSLGNYYKLQFRDDPLYVEDLFSLREAGAMAGGEHYSLFTNDTINQTILQFVVVLFLLLILARGRMKGWKARVSVTLAAAAVAGCLAPLYLDANRYASIDNYEHLNRWSPTQEYVAHGCIYPFLHTVSDLIDTAPQGYSAQKAETLLAAYQDADIPEDRKINVIAIMREAYVDFSQYGIAGFDGSCYETFHQLKAESYCGDLLTNIFAGGTVDTERCFLTGNYKVRNFRHPVNSYLWYFRSQGYTVEGSHPYYQWFYNRQNINTYLGFERYRFYEEDYEKKTQALLPEDAILYPEIYQDFVANKSTGKPYFSFSVNVQSHGPYDTVNPIDGPGYLHGNYSDKCKNAMNHYMDTIMQGDEELMKLVEQLRADPDPIVLVLFSDHLPWMGDGNVFYEEMGIDINPRTEEGFRTHYTTEYLLWANPAAQDVLGGEIVGEGPTISPCYLMNLLFEKCGWDGPAFLQAMGDFLPTFSVVTTHACYVIDGQFTNAIPTERKELFQDFLYLQHYWRNVFLYAE